MAADRDRIQAEARIVCGTTTRADVEWLAESNELLTAELDETRAALAVKEEALARAEAETERLRKEVESYRPLIAALAIYGEGANLKALAEKAADLIPREEPVRLDRLASRPSEGA